MVGHFFCMVLVVYTYSRPWDFSSGIVAVLFFSKTVFGRGLELPKSRYLRKKMINLYRSTREE